MEFRRVPKSSETTLDSLSETEVETYAFLDEHGASRTAEVAEAMGLTPRGTLKALKKLVERGVVVAQDSTSDRTYRPRDDARQHCSYRMPCRDFCVKILPVLGRF